MACIKLRGEVNLGSKMSVFSRSGKDSILSIRWKRWVFSWELLIALSDGRLNPQQLEVKMKKILFVALIMSLLLVLAVPVVMADDCPGNGHQSCASTFKGKGGASEFVHDHVSNAGGNGNGMPAVHGVSGMEFGAAVSACAPISQNHSCDS